MTEHMRLRKQDLGKMFSLSGKIRTLVAEVSHIGAATLNVLLEVRSSH